MKPGRLSENDNHRRAEADGLRGDIYADEVGGLYHALNRANMRATIFRSLGNEGWVESIARRLNLECTLRPRGGCSATISSPHYRHGHEVQSVPDTGRERSRDVPCLAVSTR